MEKQIGRLKELWKLLPFDQQIKIVTDEIERVGWDKLPWVCGWKYKAVVMVGDTMEVVSPGGGRSAGGG